MNIYQSLNLRYNLPWHHFAIIFDVRNIYQFFPFCLPIPFISLVSVCRMNVLYF